ncbi:MAG: ornithine cyclodeaminase family protein [Phycisphaerae bacterium]|nr:ornithine cyclodeaminase family protein [Phycisphaerae bacterium]
MNTPPLLYLNSEEVRRALPMPDAIDAMKRAFIQLSTGRVVLPTRQHIDVSGENGTALIMACHSGEQKLFSVKFITLFDNNRNLGLPLIQAIVILSDAISGVPLAIMDGGSLTAIRTGAASGAATDILARSDAHLVAIFGAGVQARTQLEAVCSVRPIRQARVFDPNPAQADRFAEELSKRVGLPIERAKSPAQALIDADIVCTATPSPIPVFQDYELPPGVHINAVGSYKPQVSEIPPDTVCRARVVVDHRPSALEEAGDLLIPLKQGRINESHFSAELGEVLTGRAPGRKNSEEVTLFKSVGVAIQDLCAAWRALENARSRKLGVELPR